MNEFLCLAGVWLCTYLLHSTLLLGTVATVDRFRWVKSTTVLETLWRFAVVGGLVTTTFHCFGRNLYSLDGPTYSLGQWLAPANVSAATESPATLPKNHLNSTVVVQMPSKLEPAWPNSISVQTDLTYAYAERFAMRFTSVLTLIWGVVAMMKTIKLISLGMQVRSELKGRRVLDKSLMCHFRPITESPELFSPKLTVTDCIAGPISLPNGEVVFPQWVFDSLSEKHQNAIYSHELAHQIRHDPIWLLFLQLLNAVLWIQPIHRLASRRLSHLAELQADAWAARKLADGRILAECLHACAERMIAPPSISFVCSFSSQGALVERVDFLLDGTAMSKPDRHHVTPVIAAISLLFAMFLMPGCDVDTDMAYRSGQRISVTKQGDGKLGEATIRRANLFVKLSHNGTIKLTTNNDDVESLENGGQFKLEESQGSSKRIYTVIADKTGVIKRSYSLNGKETPIDENVHQWFANTLQNTVRESGF